MDGPPPRPEWGGCYARETAVTVHRAEPGQPADVRLVSVATDAPTRRYAERVPGAGATASTSEPECLGLAVLGGDGRWYAYRARPRLGSFVAIDTAPSAVGARTPAAAMRALWGVGGAGGADSAP